MATLTFNGTKQIDVKGKDFCLVFVVFRKFATMVSINGIHQYDSILSAYNQLKLQIISAITYRIYWNGATCRSIF
jgi:hypothetical protein